MPAAAQRAVRAAAPGSRASTLGLARAPSRANPSTRSTRISAVRPATSSELSLIHISIRYGGIGRADRTEGPQHHIVFIQVDRMQAAEGLLCVCPGNGDRIAIVLPVSLISVSYTHLDVYKRQSGLPVGLGGAGGGPAAGRCGSYGGRECAEGHGALVYPDGGSGIPRRRRCGCLLYTSICTVDERVFARFPHRAKHLSFFV